MPADQSTETPDAAAEEASGTTQEARLAAHFYRLVDRMRANPGPTTATATMFFAVAIVVEVQHAAPAAEGAP